MSAIYVLGAHWLSACLTGVLASLAAWLVGNAEGEDITDGGRLSAVQLPPNVFQNYGEAEEDDPYRYYQPNYPAPRPVSPDDPALALDDVELRSPGVHRGARSLGDDEENVEPKRRLKRGAKTLSGLIKWEEVIGGRRAARWFWLGGLEPLRTNQQVPDVEDFLWTS